MLFLHVMLSVGINMNELVCRSASAAKCSCRALSTCAKRCGNWWRVIAGRLSGTVVMTMPWQRNHLPTLLPRPHPQTPVLVCSVLWCWCQDISS